MLVKENVFITKGLEGKEMFAVYKEDVGSTVCVQCKLEKVVTQFYFLPELSNQVDDVEVNEVFVTLAGVELEEIDSADIVFNLEDAVTLTNFLDQQEDDDSTFDVDAFNKFIETKTLAGYDYLEEVEKNFYTIGTIAMEDGIVSDVKAEYSVEFDEMTFYYTVSTEKGEYTMVI